MGDLFRDSVLVIGSSPASLERRLNDAVELVIGYAIVDGRKGILVTQHSDNTYTVALCREVPYGQTFERRQAD